MQIQALIRSIPDYPKPGVMFRDITTLLKDRAGFRFVVDTLATRYRGVRVDKVAGIESRGFILGAPLAYALGAGFVPLRKRGKLPGETVGRDYALEYGADRIELHVDGLTAGERALLLDDLIATGGTAEAGALLIEQAGAELIECCFVIELPELGGRARLERAGRAVFSLVSFPGH